MSAAAAIDGAGVHAGATADAVERAAEFGAAQNVAAAVINDDDVHFPIGHGAVEMGRVGGNGLPGGRAPEQAQEDAQVGCSGNEFFDPHAGDMELGKGDSQVAVPFVGTDNEPASLCDGKIDAGDPSLGLHELLAQFEAGCFDEVWGINVAVFGPQVFVEERADFFSLDMDGGHDDVAGWFVAQLDDPFSQIGIDDLEAVSFEEGVQVAFFGEHRLAFDYLLDAVLLQNAEDDFIMLGCVLRPVDRHAEGLCVGFELFEVVGEPGHGVQFDLRGPFAEGLPFGEGVDRFIALRANEPDGLIVPMGAAGIGNELTGFGGVIEDWESRVHLGLA